MIRLTGKVGALRAEEAKTDAASIRAYQPGEKVTLTVQRDGKSDEVEVTLGSDAETE